MNYVTVNAPMMDSVSASNMSRVAIINSGHPSEPLAETKHHERPLTLQLSFSQQLDSHWSLSTGLSYTSMKSTFQGGNEDTHIHRTQRLQYLGIPIRVNYHFTGSTRWSLYTSGGLQLDLPVNGRLSTQYIYGGSYADPEISPAIKTSISAPWQWSVGVGAGLQYEIVPHLKVYMEPTLNYFIPSSDAVETYRTEHPFDLTLPLGIRFTW
jgi:RNA polymerase sigma-70 factor (ECF subfamily)